VIDGETLYGRGAADMKTGVAAMTIACEEFVAENPGHRGSIALLLTSDEEGPAVDGTVKVVQYLSQQHTKIDFCLVAEPSSTNALGDEIKNGRRGSLNGHVTVVGKQGHVAYPHLAMNPIHQLASVLAELCDTEWDLGNEHFPATTFQVSNIQAGTGAENVIPETAEARFNFRFSTETTADELQQQVEFLFAERGLEYDIQWRLSGNPFLTAAGKLIDACRVAIKDVVGTETKLSTGGGTSDGRFIATVCDEVVELGVINATIHQVDECVDIHDLGRLKDIYKVILKRLLG
jgi:succinyl-diaminopimelate desuccinylase